VSGDRAVAAGRHEAEHRDVGVLVAERVDEVRLNAARRERALVDHADRVEVLGLLRRQLPDAASRSQRRAADKH
jgi:hypothetical protein